MALALFHCYFCPGFGSGENKSCTPLSGVFLRLRGWFRLLGGSVIEDVSFSPTLIGARITGWINMFFIILFSAGHFFVSKYSRAVVPVYGYCHKVIKLYYLI